MAQPPPGRLQLPLYATRCRLSSPLCVQEVTTFALNKKKKKAQLQLRTNMLLFKAYSISLWLPHGASDCFPSLLGA